METRNHEPHCPVPRAESRGEGAACQCRDRVAEVGGPYRHALDVQDACNLSGVVHQFSEDVAALWKEGGADTGYVNRHPVVQLYLEKLCQLAGMTAGVADHNALYHCIDKAKEQTGKASCLGYTEVAE